MPLLRQCCRFVALSAPADDSDRRRRPVSPGEAGLTLIEMIVVLAIIALVAALIVPNVIGRPDEARVTTTKTDLKSVAAALRMYRLDAGGYPTTEQGLDALVERPTTGPAPRNYPAEPYLSQLPQDAWGNPYQYRASGGRFELKSLGADNAPGGEGTDADIDWQAR